MREPNALTSTDALAQQPGQGQFTAPPVGAWTRQFIRRETTPLVQRDKTVDEELDKEAFVRFARSGISRRSPRPA